MLVISDNFLIQGKKSKGEKAGKVDVATKSEVINEADEMVPAAKEEVAAAKEDVIAARKEVAAAKKELTAAENKVAAAENKVAAAEKKVSTLKRNKSEGKDSVLIEEIEEADKALESARGGLENSKIALESARDGLKNSDEFYKITLLAYRKYQEILNNLLTGTLLQ